LPLRSGKNAFTKAAIAAFASGNTKLRATRICSP
jgi:hypothetical protein